jgi:hypothetical protein
VRKFMMGLLESVSSVMAYWWLGNGPGAQEYNALSEAG